MNFSEPDSLPEGSQKLVVPGRMIEDTEATRRIRAATLILLGLQLLFAAGDFRANPLLFAHGLLQFHLLRSALLAAGFALTFTAFFTAHWRGVTLLFCALMLGIGTAASIASGQSDVHLVTLALFVLAAGIFVPWGEHWQFWLNLIGLALFGADRVVAGAVGAANMYRWAGMLATVGLAQMASRFVGQYRENLYGYFAELQKSESRLRAVIETEPDSVIIASGDGTIVQINRAGTAMLDSGNPQDIVGQPISRFVAPEFHDAVKRLLEGAREGGLMPSEFESIGLKGGKRWMEAYAARLADTASEEHFLLLSRDITSRKRTESELRDSEEKLARVFQSAIDGIAINTVDGRFVDFNEEFLRITGYSREELASKSGLDLSPDAGVARQLTFGLLRNRIMRNLELKIATKSGAVISAITSIALIELHGKPCTLTFVQDITGHKKTDELLRLTQFSIENAADLIFWIDPQGRFLYGNQAACQALGFMPNELLKLRIADIEPAAAASSGNWHQVQVRGNYTFETTLRTGGGSMLPVEITASHFRYNGTDSICAFARDLRARHLAERARELARSNTELEQFASLASHDLQEPLRIISSYLNLLEKRYRGKLDSQADQFIGYAVDSAVRMQQLTDDLLAYARVGGPQITGAADCQSVLMRALNNLSLTIQESGALITYDELPALRGDPSLLIQLFQNLVGNGIKFRGEQPPKIHISACQREADWLFSVRDNGIGIDPKYAERIFALFQRLHSRAEYPGSGVGLATCRKIVERHGGRIWVESEPGKGATFLFSIPSTSMDSGSAAEVG